MKQEISIPTCGLILGLALLFGLEMLNLPKPEDAWIHLGLGPLGFPLPGLQRTHSS